MMKGIKVLITEEEWYALSQKKRDRIKFLLTEYGYDIGTLEEDKEDGWN